MKQRIQKVLASAGVASRRASEELVREGRVQVNGKTVRELPVMVDPQDEIRVDGRPIRARSQRSAPTYIVMNKPPHVVCTNVAQHTARHRQQRAIDLLPPGFRRRVYPVGRLEAASRGLLLLTDDGELTQKLTHPSFGVPKTYRVICEGEVPPAKIDKLKQGITLDGRQGRAGPRIPAVNIKIVRRGREASTLEITLKEGRSQQIRRMLSDMGHKVLDLKRVRIGPIRLQKLPEGSSRLLTRREVAELCGAVRPRTVKPTAPDSAA